MESKKPKREIVREEMNLAEFPLALASPRDKRKTVELSDSVLDKATGKRVFRTWTITAADKFGLPHGSDLDICLALQKLTREKNCLESGELPFSLRELAREVRWPTGGTNTNQIKNSLLRFLGVTIACENSWRKNGKWVSLDAFHILSRVVLSRTKEKFDADEEQRIKWHDVVLDAMRDGNLATLDWELYLGLERNISKRLYQFVNKRFHIIDGCTYDLVSFCENKMGMWQKRKTNYRQSLMTGVDELMRKGVLPRKSEDEMFSGRGLHQRVVFEKPTNRKGAIVTPTSSQEKTRIAPGPTSRIVSDLASRGMSPSRANYWASKEAEESKRQIEYFDFRTSRGWKPRNAGGYLNAAIETRQEPPEGFVSKAEKYEQRKQRKVTESKARTESAKAAKRVAAGRDKYAEQGRAVESHLSKLSEEQRRKLVDAAYRADPSKDNPIGRDSEVTRVDVVFRYLQDSFAT